LPRQNHHGFLGAHSTAAAAWSGHGWQAPPLPWGAIVKKQ
jgi:hypothetical protein